MNPAVHGTDGFFYLQMNPAVHGTDGFFAAILEKQSSP